VREKHESGTDRVGFETSNHLDDPHTQILVRPIIRNHCTWRSYLAQPNYGLSLRFRMISPPSIPRAAPKNWYAAPLNHRMDTRLTPEI